MILYGFVRKVLRGSVVLGMQDALIRDLEVWGCMLLCANTRTGALSLAGEREGAKDSRGQREEERKGVRDWRFCNCLLCAGTARADAVNSGILFP